MPITAIISLEGIERSIEARIQEIQVRLMCLLSIVHQGKKRVMKAMLIDRLF